ncbi:MAG: glycoside hydrolase family 2 protein, partial [Mucinivorans sp.]
FCLNERGAQWVDKEDWIYESHFDATPEVFDKEHVELVFEGLDTYADVYLNDSLVLHADNMFRRWRVDIKPLLQSVNNRLKVYFSSPIKVDMPKYEALPYRYEACNDQSANGGLLDRQISIFARKAGYHYGWDWGPRLVTSGIWRPVYLDAWNECRINDVFYNQRNITPERAELSVEIEIQTSHAVPAACVEVRADKESVCVEKTVALQAGVNKIVVDLTIEKPHLWWTKELGEAYLYDFTTRISVPTQEIDARSTLVGLRSLKLIRQPDQAGTSFCFELNGHPLFAKGANYIPCDVFLPRVTHSVYDKTIADAAAVHMNMLRVWGGGVYEDDYFYELCDRNGILVWQDFMFACSLYPATGAWLESVRCEAEDNLRRLRNHPSIAVWCGNNECNEAWYGWGWDNRYAKQGHPEYDKIIGDQLARLYYDVLPDAVRKFAPETPYHPSSPWSRPDGTSQNAAGDVHLWSVWHSRAPISDYNRIRSRFFSEYGFQSFPEFESIKIFAPEERDWAIESEVMMAHQRGGSFANMRIAQYMEDEYWHPKDFQSFLYMSHILQGDAVKTAIEAHRRDKPYCWGTLFWQHNDCWPVASWSSRDYYGRWKAQHYYARQAFDDLLVSPYITDGELKVYLISDRLVPVNGRLTIAILEMDGTPVYQRTCEMTASANSSRCVFSGEIPRLLKGREANSVIVSTQFECPGKTYTNIGYFAPQKEMAYPAAVVRTNVKPCQGGYDITLISDQFARGVWMSIDGIDH